MQAFADRVQGGLRVLAVVALAAVIVACAGPERRAPLGAALPPTPEARLAVLKEDLGALRRVDGTMSMGDAAIRYRAYFDGAELRYVEERVAMGDYGSSVRDFYVEGRQLRYYREQGRFAAMEPGAAPGTLREVEVELWFDADGNLTGWERLVDGRLTRVSETEIQGVIRHWNVLKQAVDRPTLSFRPAGGSSAAGT